MCIRDRSHVQRVTDYSLRHEDYFRKVMEEQLRVESTEKLTVLKKQLARNEKMCIRDRIYIISLVSLKPASLQSVLTELQWNGMWFFLLKKIHFQPFRCV